MERHLANNLLKSKNIWLGFFGLMGANWFLFQRNYLMKVYMYGHDGNGGNILKIVTDLTDEEMARLKFVKRANWHYRGHNRTYEHQRPIEDAELRDRGVEPPTSEYVEYIKRPPHDKFL